MLVRLVLKWLEMVVGRNKRPSHYRSRLLVMNQNACHGELGPYNGEPQRAAQLPQACFREPWISKPKAMVIWPAAAVSILLCRWTDVSLVWTTVRAVRGDLMSLACLQSRWVSDGSAVGLSWQHESAPVPLPQSASTAPIQFTFSLMENCTWSVNQWSAC